MLQVRYYTAMLSLLLSQIEINLNDVNKLMSKAIIENSNYELDEQSTILSDSHSNGLLIIFKYRSVVLLN